MWIQFIEKLWGLTEIFLVTDLVRGIYNYSQNISSQATQAFFYFSNLQMFLSKQ